MDGLDVSKLPLDLLLNILNIILLFLITRFLVYKPVKKFLNQRKERIEAEKAEAQQQMDEAQKLKDEYNSLLSEAEEKSRQTVLDGEEKARQQAMSIVEQAKKQSDEILADARQQATLEKEKTLSSLQGDVASLAVSISEKILAREIKDSDNKRIVDEFLKSGENE
jgi:F-type H+-transporting ATPase subunit b